MANKGRRHVLSSDELLKCFLDAHRGNKVLSASGLEEVALEKFMTKTQGGGREEMYCVKDRPLSSEEKEELRDSPLSGVEKRRLAGYVSDAATRREMQVEVGDSWEPYHIFSGLNGCTSEGEVTGFRVDDIKRERFECLVTPETKVAEIYFPTFSKVRYYNSIREGDFRAALVKNDYSAQRAIRAKFGITQESKSEGPLLTEAAKLAGMKFCDGIKSLAYSLERTQRLPSRVVRSEVIEFSYKFKKFGLTEETTVGEAVERFYKMYRKIMDEVN